MGILENLPLKSLIPIFVVSFFLIFVVLFMVMSSMYCGEEVEGPTGCMIIDFGTFIPGILVAGMLFLLDMGLLYTVLEDMLIPKGPGGK